MPPLAPPPLLQPTRSQAGSTAPLEKNQGGVNIWNSFPKLRILTSGGKEPDHTLFVASLPSIIISTKKIVHCLIHIQALEEEEEDKGGGGGGGGEEGKKRKGRRGGGEKDREIEGDRKRRVRSSIYITCVWHCIILRLLFSAAPLSQPPVTCPAALPWPKEVVGPVFNTNRCGMAAHTLT